MSAKRPAMDPEIVLITIDQIHQTVEVLSAAVSRLQYYVQTHTPPPQQSELPFSEYVTGKHELH